MRSSLDQPHLPNLLIEPTLSTSSATIWTACGVLKTHGMWTTLVCPSLLLPNAEYIFSPNQ